MRALSGLLTIGLMVAAGSSARQEPTAPIFGETVEVRVVNLEAVVTDRDGLPVTGLMAGDFVLRVDGAEVPIQYFSEVRGGDAVEIEPGRGGTVSGVPELVPGTPVGTSYLLFIDEFFSIARDRDFVLRGIRDELSRLGPEDRMAIVAWDGRELEMLSSWSSSGPELARAFRAAMARKPRGLERVSEARTFGVEQQFGHSLGGSRTRRSFDSRLSLTERQYAALIEQEVSSAVSATTAALRSFANPPGRKVLILLSGGWPFDPIDYATGTLFGSVNEPGIKRGEELYAPLVATANQLGYTVYPVDVPGLVGSVANDVTVSGFNNSNGDTEAFANETITQFSLRHLAEETGGLALINAGRTRALEQVQGDTRTYYWLGFVPDWQGDDRAHDVVLEVKHQGLEVRGRTGYVDLSRQAETSMVVESVLMFGDGPDVRPLELTVGAPKRSGIARIQVPIRIQVPADEIVFLPSDESLIAQLELRVAAADESGGRSDVPVLPVRLVVDRQPRGGEKASYETVLELRKARTRIVVALYDLASGAIWSAVAEVNP